jgi:hypothetical protein
MWNTFTTNVDLFSPVLNLSHITFLGYQLDRNSQAMDIYFVLSLEVRPVSTTTGYLRLSSVNY